MELISKGEAVVVEWKSKGDYSTVYYCAMFYLLNAKNKLGTGERVTDVLSIISFVWFITLQSHSNMESNCFIKKKEAKIVNGDVTHEFVLQ